MLLPVGLAGCWLALGFVGDLATGGGLMTGGAGGLVVLRGWVDGLAGLEAALPLSLRMVCFVVFVAGDLAAG
jgi:hypothetical protein